MRIAKEIVLWILTLMLVLVCFRSGLLKLTGNGFWIRDFHRWNYPDWFRIVVGAAELASAALLLIPRMASYGAGIFAIVMLGAIYTHATHNELGRVPLPYQSRDGRPHYLSSAVDRRNESANLRLSSYTNESLPTRFSRKPLSAMQD